MDNRICEQCEHYHRDEYVNGDCQESCPNNLDYCQFKPKKEEDNA